MPKDSLLSKPRELTWKVSIHKEAFAALKYRTGDQFTAA